MELPTQQPIQPSVMLPQQPTPQKKPLKALLLLEVGFFEIAFVVIVLGGIFGILNYFNILKISTAIPFLSFLPHLPTASQPIPNSNLLAVAPSGPFTYDVRSAQTLIEKFARQTLTDTYLPTIQASGSAFFYVQNKNVFTSPWNIENGKVGTASAFITAQEVLTLQEDSNTPSFYNISLQSTSPPISSLPTVQIQDVATQIAQKVFKTPPTAATWKCQNNGSALCTASAKTSQDTTQYIIAMQPDFVASKTAVLSIFACTAPSGMPMQSCGQ